MDLDILDERLDKLKTSINYDKGKLEILEQELSEVQEQLKEFEQYEQTLTQVSLLFQKTASFAREQSKKQIESIVTKCLQFVFETDIEFIIELSESRGVPVAEFYVQSNYEEGYAVKTKPELSRGGGVVDIIAIALRIAFLQIHQPQIEGSILLDEPGKHVSDDFIFNLGEFVKKTSTLFHRQIIMITHNVHLSQICDKSFIVEINQGVSDVKENPNI